MAKHSLKGLGYEGGRDLLSVKGIKLIRTMMKFINMIAADTKSFITKFKA